MCHTAVRAGEPFDQPPGDGGREQRVTRDRIRDVYGLGHLAALGLGGLVITSLAALLPAGWAAATRTATALRTE